MLLIPVRHLDLSGMPTWFVVCYAALLICLLGWMCVAAVKLIMGW